MKSASWLLAVALVASLLVMVPPGEAEAGHVLTTSSSFQYIEVEFAPGVDIRRELRWEFTPGHVQPGDTVEVTFRMTNRTTHKGLGCSDGTDPSPTVEDLLGSTAIFMLDSPSDPSPWYLGPGLQRWRWIEGTSTRDTYWIDTCPLGADQIQETVDETVGVIEVGATAPPGCYRLHRGTSSLDEEAEGADWGGDFTLLQVGDGPICDVVSSPFTLTASTSFSVTFLNAGASAVGIDQVVVTGDGADSIGMVCLFSDWTAAVDLVSPSSTPIQWNVQIPQYWDIDSYVHSKPDKEGFFTRIYMDRVVWSECADGQDLTIPALAGNTMDGIPPDALHLTSVGTFLKLKHKVTAVAYWTNGEPAASLELGHNAKPTAESWAKTESVLVLP